MGKQTLPVWVDKRSEISLTDYVRRILAIVDMTFKAFEIAFFSLCSCMDFQRNLILKEVSIWIIRVDKYYAR